MTIPEQNLTHGQIISYLKDFLAKLCVSTQEDPQIQEDASNLILVNISTNEPQLLIGKNATNLNSLQHLLNILLRRQIEEFDKKLVIDINNYRQAKIKYLKEIVKEASVKAMTTKKTITLKPMNSFERRVVHLELVNHPDLTTQSIGTGKDRRVIIKPYSSEI